MLDLAPYLRPGENTIAIFVIYYGKPRSFWMPAASGGALGGRGVFVFEANLQVSAPEDGWLISDASWKALKSDAWSEDWKNPAEMHPLFGDAIPTEVVDASRLPFGWEQPGFDDSAWGVAHIIAAGGPAGSGGRTQPPTDPYGPLHPRPIGKLGGDLRIPTAVRVETLTGQVAAERRSGHSGCRRRSTCLRARTVGDRMPLAVDVPAGWLRPHHAGHGRHRHGAGAVRDGGPGRHGARLLVYVKSPWHRRVGRSMGYTPARATWRAARTTTSRFSMRSASATPIS